MVDQIRSRQLSDDPTRNETIVAEGVSFEDFLRIYAEQHAEWLMGKVILIVSNNTRHQMLQGFLYNLISYFLGINKMGRVLMAGVPMFISEDQPAREPDLLVVLREHDDRIKENSVNGPADIVVEIVSPESINRDWGTKMTEYEMAGVQEYLLIDPLRQEADLWALGQDGRYHRRALDEQGRIASSVLPGFALDPVLFWQDEYPAGPDMAVLVQSMLD